MIVITRFLTNVDLGVYYASAAYPQLLSRILDLGIPHAARYYILQFPSAVGFIVRLVVIFSLLVALPILAIFYFLGKLHLESIQITSILANHSLVLSFYCLLLIVNSIFNSIVISIQRYWTILFASTLPYLIFIPVIVILFYRFHLDVNDILFQLLISEFVVLIIYSVSIVNRIIQDRKDKSHVSLKSIEVLRYAIQVYPSGFLKIMTTRLDKVILSVVASPVFIGYYSVLMTIRDISIFPITTYSQVFMNNLSQAFKDGSNEIHRLINKSVWGILGVYGAGFIVYLFIQKPVLGLFFKEVAGEAYQAAFFLFLSIIPLALLSFISYIFLVTNRPKYVSYASIISIIIFYSFIFLSYRWLDSASFFYASVFSVLGEFIYLLINYKNLVRRKLL